MALGSTWHTLFQWMALMVKKNYISTPQPPLCTCQVALPRRWKLNFVSTQTTFFAFTHRACTTRSNLTGTWRDSWSSAYCYFKAAIYHRIWLIETSLLWAFFTPVCCFQIEIVYIKLETIGCHIWQINIQFYIFASATLVFWIPSRHFMSSFINPFCPIRFRLYSS